MEKTANQKTKKKKKHRWKHKDVNSGQKSFANGLNMYKIIWVFAIGCLLGVLIETFYVYFMTGELMRRSGMLWGPFNQVYGFGAVLITSVLYRFRHSNAIIIFVVSGILGMAFEYACSFVQEHLFGSKSWEYSNMPANIGGRTNLFYGVFWGLIGLVFIMHSWPFLSEIIERIPNTIGKTLSIVVIVFLAINLFVSAAAVLRYGQRFKQNLPKTAVGQFIDKTWPDEVMQQKYPSMKFDI